MHTYHHGRHEHGQNFLTDTTTISRIIDLVAETNGPIIEIGPGDGALTTRLADLGRPLTAVEIDARLARSLQQRTGREVHVEHTDFLAYRLPQTPHVLVGNLPFHQTTAMLRRILHAPGWSEAILLVQWEVARRRAGVGTSTMMTAQWAPWVNFSLHGRVPAHAFTPRPGVDGGILRIERLANPAIQPKQRRQYQALVHRVFTGSGKGLAQILARTTGLGSTKAANRWLRRHSLTPAALPRDISTAAWIDLFAVSGTSPPRQGTGSPAPPRRGRRGGAGAPRRG